MSSPVSDSSYDSYFCPWECMHSDLEDSDSCQTSDYDDTSTDESAKNTVTIDENIFICIYDKSHNINMAIISTAMEIKRYRKKYSQLTKKSNKNVQNIWDDVIIFTEEIGSVPLRTYKHCIDEDLNKKIKDKQSSQDIKKNIALDNTDTRKSNTVENSCKSKQSEIKQRSPKEVPKASDKKIEPELPINSNLTQNIKSSQTKGQENNINLKDKNEKTDHETIDKKVQILTTDQKNIQANSKNNNSKSTANNIEKSESSKTNIKSTGENKTENNNSNDKSNIDKFKKPDSVDKLIVNGTPTKTKVDKSINSCVTNQTKNINNVADIVKSETGAISKKKLKKQRQKENKINNSKRNLSNSSSKETSESSNKTSINRNTNFNSNVKKDKINNIKVDDDKQNKSQNKNSAKEKTSNNFKVEEPSEESDTDGDKTTDMNTSDDNMDLLTDSDNIPAFIEAVKRKAKKKNNKTKSNSTETSKNTEKKVDSTKMNEGEFILYTKKREPSHPNKVSLPIPEKRDIIYSDEFAEKAVDMILENKLMGGLQYLVEALEFDPTDHRHYLNRSYCYLRVSRYPLALEDARYVIHTSTHIGHLFVANLRAGQAAFALQEYELAEAYLKEATRINPENHHAQRELMRTKLAQIMRMGFNERDSLLALDMYSSTSNAINYLIDNKSQVNTSLTNDCDIYYENCDDLIYSSDEDEKPNNIEILNRILHYEPGKIKFRNIETKPSNTSSIAPLLSGKNISNKSNAEKKVTLNSKVASKQTVGKAIWVGSLTSSITEAMLKKKFKQFGNIVSIYQPSNEAYAFINFEKSEDVLRALASANHEIDGVKLCVRSAVRQK